MPKTKPALELSTPFTSEELVVVRRAYARQVLATLGVVNPEIEAAFATVPREQFLGDPPWQVTSLQGGYRNLSSSDPVLVYQDQLFALSPTRGVNNGSPSLHAKLLDALGPAPGEHIAHIGAGTGYYSAILAELVGPSGHVTAVEFDPLLAKHAKQALADRPNVEVIVGDGAAWPKTPVDGVYVNFAVMRPADRWIDNLAPGGRLVFPLGIAGPQMPGFGGRHSNRGAAFRIEHRTNGFEARAISIVSFVCAEGEFKDDPVEAAALRKAFETGGLNTVRSLVWKTKLPDQAWYLGYDWALSSAEIT